MQRFCDVNSLHQLNSEFLQAVLGVESVRESGASLIQRLALQKIQSLAVECNFEMANSYVHELCSDDSPPMGAGLRSSGNSTPLSPVSCNFPRTPRMEIIKTSDLATRFN